MDVVWRPERGFSISGYRRAQIGAQEVAWIYRGSVDFTYWWRGRGKGKVQPKGSGSSDSESGALKNVKDKLREHWGVEC